MAVGSNSGWDELDRKMFGSAAPTKQPRLSAPTQMGIPGATLSDFLGGKPSGIKPPSEEDPSLAEIELNKARINAAQRILSDPVARTQNPDFLIKELEKIASGGKPSGRSAQDKILGGFGEVAEGFLYGLGRPLAVVASAAKEISDLTTGDASLKDFVTQALDKDTAVSTFMPKTGNKWLDQTIGFAADIVFDPLTYVTFGASAYAGRMGRLRLASKAAEEEMIAKVPSLAKKVADGSIARLGEWALDAAEREALGVTRGLSWTFGGGVIGKPGTTLGKISESLAENVGGRAARLRAGIGDLPISRPFQRVTAPKSVKIANLTMYGRVADDPENVDRIRDLASFSAAVNANANGGYIAKKFGSAGQKLVKEIRDYETATGRRIHEVREGVRSAVDDVEQSLADRSAVFINQMKDDMNERTANFGARRNVKAYRIEHRDNYVPHTLTQEARDFIGSKRWAGTRFDSSIRQSLGMTAKEFAEGPPPLQGRKLLNGEKWFGRTLKSDIGDGIGKLGDPDFVPGSASIREINDTSENVLGFKWFQEDGGEYISNYLDSIVAQTKRLSYTDRLFDYGIDVVRPVGQKIIKDKQLIRELTKATSLYDNMITPVLEELSRAGVGAQDILGPRLSLAQLIADSAPGAKILTPEQVDKIRTVLKATVQQIKQADGIAATKPREIREAYETVTAPLRGRLDAVTQALDADDHENLLATSGLRELYQRLLPDADDIPTDPKALAEDIIDAAKELRGTPIAKGLDIGKDFNESIQSALRGIQRRENIVEIPSGTGPVVASRQEAEDYASRLANQLANKEATPEGLIGMERTAKELGGMARKTEAGFTLADLEAQIKRISANRDRALKKAKTPKEAAAIKSRATRQLNPLRTEVGKMQAIMDTGKSLTVAKDEWNNSVGRLYADDFKRVLDDIGIQPPPGAAAEAMSMWTERTRDILNSLDNPSLQLTPEEYATMSRLITQMKGLETNLALYEQAKDFTAEQLAKASRGEIGAQYAKQVIRGWTEIESLGVQMPPEMRDRLFGKVDELITPQGQKQWEKIYNSYNRFFKVTAMLSPGFIVRNSYTATFNNFVAGVSPADVARGLRFATDVWRNGLDNAMAKLPAETRDLYERAIKVAYATGAGQSADDIMAPVLAGKGAKWVNKQPIRGWANANETAEVAARFSLALSSLKKGLDFDGAVAQVARYHFDYTDLSSLDETMRKFVPFWIFASRNIPLQLVNQVARPSVYRMYESAQRNFPADMEGDENAPEWLRRRNPLRLPFMGPGEFIDVDLPHLDMREQVNMMTNPIRLLSQFNPLLKLPIEMSGGTQLWSGAPFSRKPQEVRGPLDYPAYALGALFGDAGTNPQTGKMWTSSKAAYAVPNLVPLLGAAQRLIPELGGKESYQDRAGSSRAAFFGLPYRRVSPQEQFNELTRRQFAIRDYMSGLTRRGITMPKEN